MGVLIDSGKAITIHNFNPGLSWMMAALFRFDCNSASLVASPGVLFEQLSSDGSNAYALRVKPNLSFNSISV